MNGFTQYFANVKKKFKVKNFIPYFVFLAAILLMVILQAAGTLKKSDQQLLEQIGYYVIAAMSLSLVVGFLGELSIGHAAFMSIGAFVGVWVRNAWLGGLNKAAQKSAQFPSLLVAVLAGGLVAAVAGFIIGLPALRLKGDYLAIVTLAFGEIVKTVLKNVLSGGESVGELKSTEGRYPVGGLFIIVFILALLTLVVINNLIRSKHGRAIMAVRDNEIAARAMGVNVTYYKLSVFVISAFFAGVAGVFFGMTQYSVNPANFDYNKSIDLLVMVVLGGMGNINGSIIAAIVITVLNTKLGVALTGNLAALKNLIYALVLILIVVYNNAPKLKTVREKYNFKRLTNFLYIKLHNLFTRKKYQHDPAKEQEFGADWSVVPTKVEMDAILSTDFTPDNSFTPDKPDKPKGDK